ncbi:ATP-dependent Clp protease ATP-binding subunit [Treponema pectinovorum]|uniref:ATP-dependent Clp protease ATP-binding subunit n=1 Tax=Treponema pectinovorum TaxID=164 RepID=UPI0011CC7F0F|nr:ATP-dependent Clp protease ATP-binding subunit [Treponema pectinovorum]
MKKISPRIQRIFILAQEEGHRSGSTELLPEHVLLALLKMADGLGYTMLQDLALNVLTFQLAIEQSLVVRNAINELSELPLSRRLRTVMDIAALESSTLRNDYIGTEHFLLASSREEGSASYKFFARQEITTDILRNVAKNVQEHFNSSANMNFNQLNQIENTAQKISDGTEIFQNQTFSPEFKDLKKKQNTQQSSFLSQFSRDLTALSKENALDPVVGRSKEIDRVIQILSRRTKNNPVLIGEPGVGKTAIVEGLAQKISKGNVPFNLLKKRVLLLDMAALVAGTKYRGEFEERMKRMMKEILEDKNIILFIDELHTIIGAGGPEGAMDASNILKPALSRGEIQIIGATTTKEYRKYFEKDTALERRFQSVKVEEPSFYDTIEILNGLKQKYEEFHGVCYDDDVIPTIVKFAERYIPERFLPDKAIDILDEAGSAKKINESAQPTELAELEKSIEQLSSEKKELVANQNYEKAAEIRDKVRELKLKLEDFSTYWKNNSSSLKKKVSVKDVCAIIANMTGIPLEQLDANETHRLLSMENYLHKSVIGQDEAIKVLSGAIRRSRAGVSSSDRPLGSFIFLGPTGVGKTQLAKSLAEFLFGTKDSLIRIDMSDYMEKHNASRLVGAPPGYVGFDEGGILTEKVRQHPYSVVLLDEIEKAHPDVFNLLLQLLEEGELSDNFGHTVNFRNTVIIMTSNAGARQVNSEHRLGFSSSQDGLLPYTEIKANAMEELKRIMRPEFLNRIDDIVVFDALNRKQISSILDIQLKELESRLSELQLSLVVKPKAREYLLDNGYEPSMGARPMRRLIQNEIEEQLSLLILEGKVQESKNVVVDLSKGKILVKNQKSEIEREVQKEKIKVEG